MAPATFEEVAKRNFPFWQLVSACNTFSHFPVSYLTSFLMSRFYNLSPLRPIKAFMLAAPKLTKANYRVTHLQAFAEDIYSLLYFLLLKREERKTEKAS